MVKTETQGLTLTVRRVIKAAPEMVYKVWTDPAYLTRWNWGKDHTTISVSIDCRVGGIWKQQIKSKVSGEEWWFDGEFREVVPNTRLVHTFHWRNDKGVDHGTSLVRVDFSRRDDGTEVVITHTQLSTEELRKGTETGWADVLTQIESCLP